MAPVAARRKLSRAQSSLIETVESERNKAKCTLSPGSPTSATLSTVGGSHAAVDTRYHATARGEGKSVIGNKGKGTDALPLVDLTNANVTLPDYVLFKPAPFCCMVEDLGHFGRVCSTVSVQLNFERSFLYYLLNIVVIEVVVCVNLKLKPRANTNSQAQPKRCFLIM